MQSRNETPDFRSLYPRLLNFGVAYGDLERISKSATDWLSFADQMSDLASGWEKAGDEAFAAGRLRTPREHWRKATDYYHYAQLRVPDSLLKEKLRTASRRCFTKLVPLLDVQPVRHEIPFQSIHLPGYLRVSRPGAPCVILIGGLDSSKEVELHYFAELFLQRGCSVFYFDGPGQGELFGKVPVSSRFENSVANVIKYLISETCLDSVPIGCFGVSFGGYLACRSAAANSRISACISIGGFYDHRILRKLPPVASAAVRKSFGFSTDDDLSELERYVSLQPLKGQMKAPLLIVHGTADHLVDMEQIDAMTEWADGPVDRIILEGSEHVCCDRFNVCLPQMGDWMTNCLMFRNRGMLAVV